MMTLILKRTAVLGILLIGSSFLTACTLLHDLWYQDELAEYGETVFRKQNALTNQVMMLSEENNLSTENSQKLQQAEAQMRNDCKLLNEYATREMDKADIDLSFKQQVKNSVPGCDASLQKLETLLKELGF